MNIKYDNNSEMLIEYKNDVVIEYNEETTTLEQLFSQANEPFASVSHYYSFSEKYCAFWGMVPYYIGKDGVARWFVNYDYVLVDDFISTHRLAENTISAYTGVCPGGMGDSANDLWKTIYPIIDQFGTVVGVLGVIVEAGRFLKGIFYRKKVHNPQALFDLIYSRNSCDMEELRKILRINRKNTTSVLKIFGFINMDNSLIYVLTEEGKENKKVLAKIDIKNY